MEPAIPKLDKVLLRFYPKKEGLLNIKKEK